MIPRVGIRAATLGALIAGVALLATGCSISVNLGSGSSAPATSSVPPTSHPSAPPISSPPPVSTSASSASPSLVTVTLTVTPIPTTYGAGSGSPAPTTVTVTLPADDQQAIGAYDAGVLVLGPAGWTGSATVGADGSVRAVLYPPGGSANTGPREILQEDGACQGCGDSDSAAYFPAVQDNWASYGWPFAPPALLSFSGTDYLSSDTLAYSLPATASGLAVNGLAYSGILANNPGLTFANLRVYLPPSETALATLILNHFQQMGL